MAKELATRRGARFVRANRDAAADPIVVANTLWQAADPEAYDGGKPSAITHLAEFEASGLEGLTSGPRGLVRFHPERSDRSPGRASGRDGP